MTAPMLTGENARFLPSAILKRGHCRFMWARNDHGEAVSTLDPDATKHCVLSALSVCAINTQMSFARLKTMAAGAALAAHMNEGKACPASEEDAIIEWSDTFTLDSIIASLQNIGL